MLTQSISRRLAPVLRGDTPGASSRATNPIGGIVTKALIATLLVGGGWLVYREAKARGYRRSSSQLGKTMTDYALPGATLGDAPGVVEDIQLPIGLETSSQIGHLAVLDRDRIDVRSVTFGAEGDPDRIDYLGEDGIEWGWTPNDGSSPIAALVTDMTPEFVSEAYEWAVAFISQDPATWATPAAQGATVLKILTRVIPGYSDSQYRASLAWRVAMTLGEIASQSLANKQG